MIEAPSGKKTLSSKCKYCKKTKTFKASTDESYSPYSKKAQFNANVTIRDESDRMDPRLCNCGRRFQSIAGFKSHQRVCAQVKKEVN